MLCASLMVSLIFWWFQGESLYQWGWRIAFLFAAFSGFIGFYIRAKTMETSDFQSLHEQCAVEQYPLKLIVASHKLLMIQLIGLYLFSALVTYLAFIFMPIYLTDILNYSRTQAHTINTVMLLLLIVMDIFFGTLSDKIGRKGLMFTSAISLSVLAYPLYYLLLLGSNTGLAGAFQGPLLALTIDLVPVSVRYTLGSLSYNLAYSFFGGTAPILALSLINKTGNKAIPGAYLAFGAMIATFSLFKLTVKKVRKVSLSTML
ncbi:MFS transporter [Rickettsiella massiliensis]|uniref:MFS transporter n=1 Tax=Rickettsiella massiliensis TaxID=676517 RepID=UPI00029A832B|nr:MFS transporter [Rickettsiella massiliensis]